MPNLLEKNQLEPVLDASFGLRLDSATSGLNRDGAKLFQELYYQTLEDELSNQRGLKARKRFLKPKKWDLLATCEISDLLKQNQEELEMSH